MCFLDISNFAIYDDPIDIPPVGLAEGIGLGELDFIIFAEVRAVEWLRFVIVPKVDLFLLFCGLTLYSEFGKGTLIVFLTYFLLKWLVWFRFLNSWIAALYYSADF